MKIFFYFFLTGLVLSIFLGYSNSDNPNDFKANLANQNKSIPVVTDNNNNNTMSTVLDYYSDDFVSPNNVADLSARGYLVYRNGTFTPPPPTPAPNFWFTGNPAAFFAFNGDSNDYIASNYFTAGAQGNIDNWLILPELDVVALDSICFRSRSTLNSLFRDSIRVKFNPLGGTLPNSPGWIELGRFRVDTTGVWERRRFAIPSSALNARLAITYTVFDGGKIGANSNYIGIDELRVQGAGIISFINIEKGVPNKYDLSQNYPNPFNPSTIVNYQLPSLSNVKLSIYDISGKEVRSLINGRQEAGYYSFKLNASDLSSGIYFYTLSTENFVETNKMILVK